jgi:hypothetical protein
VTIIRSCQPEENGCFPDARPYNADVESSTLHGLQPPETIMPQLTPQEDSDRNRRILAGDPGRSDRKPGYRVKHRTDGRTGVIVGVVRDPLSGATAYTVRWDDGETVANVPANQLDDAFE